MKAFFSHAGEDFPVVDQIYRRVKVVFPDLAPWLDRYEIVAGNDLLDKIAAGMDEAEKFFIFLSSASVDKPWVKAELKRAIMREITNVEPDYIVPVKLGHIATVPAWIESKYHIDLERLTEAQWLQEFEAAIRGIRRTPQGAATANLQVTKGQTSDEPLAAFVLFEARYWAEQISFVVTTSSPIVLSNYQFPNSPSPGALNFSELEEPQRWGIRIEGRQVTPGHSFAMVLKFGEGVDPVAAIIKAEPWDGAGATSSGTSFFGA